MTDFVPFKVLRLCLAVALYGAKVRSSALESGMSECAVWTSRLVRQSSTSQLLVAHWVDFLGKSALLCTGVHMARCMQLYRHPPIPAV